MWIIHSRACLSAQCLMLVSDDKCFWWKWSKRALSGVFRRLSSSGDLLRPTLFSAFRLHVDIFSKVKRRRRRMMLRLAFVETSPAPDVLHLFSRYAALKVVERLMVDGLGSKEEEAWGARII